MGSTIKIKKKLGELLIESGVISEEELELSLKEQRRTSQRLGEVLVKLKICSEESIAGALATQLGMQLLDLKNTPVEPIAIEVIPEKVARKHLIIPLSLEEKDLHVAMADPMSYEAFEDVTFASGFTIKPYVATKSDIVWAIDHQYNLGASIDSIVQDISSEKVVEVLQEVKEDQKEEDDLKQKSEAAPVIRMVNILISEAVEQGASDIHLEPEKDKLQVRNRVDGMLRNSIELPKWVQGAVISRIKIMAKLDIAEKRLPQDGRIGIRVGGKMLDLRVSSLPTNFGEKVVIRLLDPKNFILSVKHLGMEQNNLEAFLSLISRTQGIILVTGPTGSGKTTTLYAALSHIKCVEKNITTIEDPIEYELEGINQVPVNEKVGLAFANALRSILRQDPDVIMVGEMRDMDTAMIAMQASLTGHLVLSTVHTNNSVSTISRIHNFGVPNYLIASTISGVISQRLLRLICPDCKTPDNPEEESLVKIGFPSKKVKGLKFFRGKGCAGCGWTGFKGRTGIYEILLFTRKIKDLIITNASESTLRQVALAEGMRTLSQGGIEKILKGETSVGEVARIIQADEDFGSLCGDCGYVLGPEFSACPHCGKRLYETCPKCKKSVDPLWRYCPYCRHDFLKSIPFPTKSQN